MTGRAGLYFQNAEVNALAAMGTAAIAYDNIDSQSAEHKGERKKGKLDGAVRTDRHKAPHREDDCRYGQLFCQLPALHKGIPVNFHFFSLSAFHYPGTVKTRSLPYIVNITLNSVLCVTNRL